jgi:hypothetical protein
MDHKVGMFFAFSRSARCPGIANPRLIKVDLNAIYMQSAKQRVSRASGPCAIERGEERLHLGVDARCCGIDRNRHYTVDHPYYAGSGVTLVNIIGRVSASIDFDDDHVFDLPTIDGVQDRALS